MNLKNPAPGVFVWACFDDRVTAAFSGREFDHQNRSAFLQALQIPDNHLVFVKQVHGDKILCAKKETASLKDQEADGLLTDQPAKALGIFTADCIPAFFYDSEHNAIALTHAGWRGVYAEILKKTVANLAKEFASKPSKIKVALGPAMRACCYEVGEEFRGYFPEFYFHPKLPNGERKVSGHFDMMKSAQQQLEKAGIRKENIADSEFCTGCLNGQFFSARKEKTAERILSVMALKP